MPVLRKETIPLKIVTNNIKLIQRIFSNIEKVIEKLIKLITTSTIFKIR